MTTLDSLSEAKLAARISKLLRIEDRAVVELVFCFAELLRRRTHLAAGYDSLFTYCTQSLRFSRSKAWRRSAAAEVVVQFPFAAELLKTRRISVSVLVSLKRALTADNHAAVLSDAIGMTEDEANCLASRLRPEPRRMDSIQIVHSIPPPPPSIASVRSHSVSPTRSEPVVSAPPVLPLGAQSGLPATVSLNEELVRSYRINTTVTDEVHSQLLAVKNALSHQVPDGNLNDVLSECFRITLEVCARRKLGTARVPRSEASQSAETSPRHVAGSLPEASTAASHEWRSVLGPRMGTGVDAGGGVVAELPGDDAGELRSVLGPRMASHAEAELIDVAQVTEPGVAHVIAFADGGERLHEERGSGSGAGEFARFDDALDPGSRHIPMAVRRAVWERDGGCCSFVGAGGRRCRSRYQLEFDHWRAFSLGGTHAVTNVRTFCRAHNFHEAERVLGRRLMRKYRRLG